MANWHQKIHSWLRERKLSPLTKAVRQDKLTYLNVDKLTRLHDAITRIKRNAVAGDILEFGVALGGSAIILASHLDGDRRFHGFDVFATIPPPTSDKDDDKSRKRFQIINDGDAKGMGGDVYYGYRDDLIGDVKLSFARHGIRVDDDRVQLHQGLFEDSWPKAGIDRIAFAHIDCDWYDPVRYCLAAVADRLSPGGLLLIDDYRDYGGCRIAVDEFIASRSDFTFEDGVNPLLRKH